MKFTAKELTALKWFMEDKKLKPLLSNPPTMFFRNQSGEVESHPLTGIVTEYSYWHADSKKEKARQVKQKKNETGRRVL